MSDSGELRQGVLHDAAVRPLALAADRACSRPSCAAPASATLLFNYAEREAWITRLAETRSPQSYDLCATHAARTQAPHGWHLRDRRPVEEQATITDAPTASAYGGADTVAVLAAALHAVPDLPTPDAPAPADPSAQSGTAASEPAAPGPAAQRSVPTGGVAPGETAAATREDSTSPVLAASAVATPDISGTANQPGPEGGVSDASVPTRPRPVLAERRRAARPRDPAADW